MAGDAVTTVKQESALALLSQRPELHGPPAYYTPDWEHASASVRLLAALEPNIVAIGHGVPMEGTAVREGLHHLARNFQRLAVPGRGRYVSHPAVADQDGVVWVPPPIISGRTKVSAALAGGLLLGTLAGSRWRS